MDQGRKYANLPDLDSAPDIYETPELTDDNSTITASHTADATSPVRDPGQDESGVSSRPFRTTTSRARFQGERVDASSADFSDRVSAKRESYRTSNARRNRGEDGREEEEYGDFSEDDDDVEGLERRIARLQREVEEVKEVIAERNESSQKSQANEVPGQETVERLSLVLEQMRLKQNGGHVVAEQKLASLLANGTVSARPKGVESTQIETTSASDPALTRDIQLDDRGSIALARAVDIESRISLLERALGVEKSALTAVNHQPAAHAVLPTLEALANKVAILSNANTSSLDGIGRQMRQLAQESQDLDQARKASQQAASDPGEKKALRIGNGDTEDGSSQSVKINALYGNLPTIESLAPTMPPLLERLRSLRIIHTNAARVSESLEELEQTQDRTDTDIKKWHEGLEKLDEAIKKSETTMSSNMKAMEGWIKSIEQKVSDAP